MEGWQWALVLKPFILFVYLIPGALLVWWLRRLMPDGKLKRFLLFSWRV